MSRVDLYGPVHKAMRWAGGRALSELGASPGDPDAVARALSLVRDLLQMHETHQRIEDELVLPAIEARRPGASVRLADAHVEHGLGIAALRDRVAEVAAGEPNPAVLRRLYLELSRFIAEDMLHMYEEETLAQPLLEEAYSQAELVALLANIQQRLAPGEKALFGTVMVAALSVIERQKLAAAPGAA